MELSDLRIEHKFLQVLCPPPRFATSEHRGLVRKPGPGLEPMICLERFHCNLGKSAEILAHRTLQLYERFPLLLIAPVRSPLFPSLAVALVLSPVLKVNA